MGRNWFSRLSEIRQLRYVAVTLRDAVNVTGTGQLGGEVVEDVGRIARPRQQHNRPSRSAPIEHLPSHTVFHGYELHLVLRPTLPGDRLLPERWRHQ